MISEFFVIASRPRSGTHLIATTLGALPDVTCLLEVFNPEQLSRPLDQRTIENMWDMQMQPRDWVMRQRVAASKDSVSLGLCVHHYQLEEMPKVKHGLMLSLPRVILARREDLLSQYVSKTIALQRAGWQSYKSDPLPQMTNGMVIEAEDFLTYCREIRASEEQDRNTWGNRPVFEVSYESLVRDFKHTMELLACFVGANHQPVHGFKAATAKQEARPIQDVVENYDELASQCEGTEFRYLFDDRQQLEEGILQV